MENATNGITNGSRLGVDALKLNGMVALANATTNGFPMIQISGSSDRAIVGLQNLDLIIPERLRAAHWRGFEAAMTNGVTTQRASAGRESHEGQ